MGNHRFKLSDMMPNAWFYKLRDMSKVRSHNKTMQMQYYASDSIANKRKTVYMPSPRMESHLPPIHTKPAVLDTPIKPRRSRSRTRKSFSVGVKIARKKPEGRRRRNAEEERKKGLFYSESFAIVKASFDPEKDFKESMMEMIVENNIRASKDLEELLACYLSLNSNHYHHTIIKAFEQIWFSMAQLHF